MSKEQCGLPENGISGEQPSKPYSATSVPREVGLKGARDGAPPRPDLNTERRCWTCGASENEPNVRLFATGHPERFECHGCRAERVQRMREDRND